MAIWNPDNILMTLKGQEVLAKVQLGIGGLTVSRVAVGSGSVSPANLYKQVALTNEVMNLLILGKGLTEGGSSLEVMLKNTDVIQSFEVHQLGVFVTHQDYAGEILYMIAQCDEGSPDVIPPALETSVALNYSMYLEHSGVADITIVISEAGTVPITIFNSYVIATNTRLDTLEGEMLSMSTVLEGVAIKTTQDTMNGKLDVLGTDLSGVKSDVSSVKTEVLGVKSDVTVVKNGVTNVETQVNATSAKMGSTNDAISSSLTTGSFFAKVNYIVSQVKDYLASIHTRMGNPIDVANNTTSSNLHQKTNWILVRLGSYWTDARAAKIDNLNATMSSRASQVSIQDLDGKIGNTTDTPSSSTTVGSLFAKVNYLVSQISTYLNLIYNCILRIGTTTDTGGSTTAGSVFAKLNAIILHLFNNWTVARAGKLDNLDTTVSSRASKTDVQGITASKVSSNEGFNAGGGITTTVFSSGIDIFQYWLVEINGRFYSRYGTKISEVDIMSRSITNSWPVSSTANWCTSCTVGTEIYYTHSSNAFWKFDTLTGIETKLPNYPGGINRMAQLVAVNDNVYFVGGAGDDYYRIDKFDPTTNTFVSLPDSPSWAGFFGSSVIIGCCVLGDEIYSFGGLSSAGGGGAYAKAWKFNVKTLTYTQLNSNPYAYNIYVVAVPLSDKLIAIISYTGSAPRKFNVYDTVSGLYSLLFDTALAFQIVAAIKVGEDIFLLNSSNQKILSIFQVVPNEKLMYLKSGATVYEDANVPYTIPADGLYHLKFFNQVTVY